MAPFSGNIIEKEKRSAPIVNGTAKFGSREGQDTTTYHPCLTGDPCMAAVILSAGRGLKDNFGFEKLLALADALHGQVVGSRGAVDMGWIPQSREVGLSGLRLAPPIYLSFGVSGTNFHTIGMYHSGLIIAVNTDKKARIFRLADYCIYADAVTVIDGLLDDLLGTSLQTLEEIRKFLIKHSKNYPFRYNSVRVNE